MEKPITLVIKETKQQIINIVNNSGIPLFILEPMFKDLYNEILTTSNQMASEQEKAYYESLKQSEVEEDVEENEVV